jgi:hypothetical protein
MYQFTVHKIWLLDRLCVGLTLLFIGSRIFSQTGICSIIFSIQYIIITAGRQLHIL